MITHIRGHSLLARPLGPWSVVLDAGANHGDFSRTCHSAYGCKPILLEANPDLVEELQHSVPFRVVHCALAKDCGVIRFNVSHNDEGSSILPLPAESRYGSTFAKQIEVPALTLADVAATYGSDRIALLKMDIEGAETSVLLSAPSGVLRKIDQITVEFHSDGDFGFDLAEDVRRTIRRLTTEGFAVFSCDPRFRDVLFINTASLPLSRLDKLRLSLEAFAGRLSVRAQLGRSSIRRGASRAWCMLPYAFRQQLKRIIFAARPRVRSRS